MIAHHSYPLTDYETFMRRVNSATDKEISAAIDKPDPKDTLIASLQAEVLRLNLELAALKAKASK